MIHHHHVCQHQCHQPLRRTSQVILTVSDSEDDIEIIKETEGQINKQGTLANLSDSDYQIILDANGWLNCDIIQQAQVL